MRDESTKFRAFKEDILDEIIVLDSVLSIVIPDNASEEEKTKIQKQKDDTLNIVLKNMATRYDQGTRVWDAYMKIQATGVAWAMKDSETWMDSWDAGAKTTDEMIGEDPRGGLTILLMQAQQTPNPGTLPGPYPSKLSRIYRNDEPKEIFSVHGGMMSRYGLHYGGGDVIDFTGKQIQLLKPLMESGFKINGDLLICEHYAGIFRWNGSQYISKNLTKRIEDLAMGIARTPTKGIFVSYVAWDNDDTVILHSNDNGETWPEMNRFHGLHLPGMCSDGDTVYLYGRDKYGEILCDINGKRLAGQPNLAYGYEYYAGCADKGIVNVSTWNSSGKGDGCYINRWVGGGLESCPIDDERPYIQGMCIAYGRRWAVSTWDWEEDYEISRKTSRLLSSGLNGKKWEEVTLIPCAHIMDIIPEDGILKFPGGCYEKRGELWGWNPN
jgi:hypothetical protein